MDAPKWAQKVSDCCPHAFNRIDVDFSNTISIVISCPLPLTMTHYRMGAVNLVIPSPSICIYGSSGERPLKHVC